MKKLLAGALLIGAMSSSFANTKDESAKLAFYGYTSHDFSRTKSDQDKCTPVPFFIGYRVLVADQNDDKLHVLNVTNNDATPTTVTHVHLNWDWELGHEGVIGVNFSNTFFSLFANGQYLRHKRTIKASVANGNIEPNPPLIGALPAAVTEATASVCGKTRFWRAGVFLAYTSYKHGSFFLMPYIGPQYYYHKLTVDSTITDVTQMVTIRPAYLKKCQGVGPLIGTTGKYYFNSVFYAYGDLRLVLPMIRETVETFSDTDTGGGPNQSLTKGKLTKFDLVFHEAVGIGFDIRQKKWEIDFMICYEVVNFYECDITYQTLGASVVFGF